MVFKTLEMLDSVEKITSSPVFANQANGALEGCILVCSYADQAKTFETCVRFGHVRDAMREEGQDDSNPLTVLHNTSAIHETFGISHEICSRHLHKPFTMYMRALSV